MLEKESRRRDDVDADGYGDDGQLWVGEHLVREGLLGVARVVRVQMSEAGRGEAGRHSAHRWPGHCCLQSISPESE